VRDASLGRNLKADLEGVGGRRKPGGGSGACTPLST
jgi:hypothetical protein